MTVEEAARFVLSDCQDPELRAKADAEAHAALVEALRNPKYKRRWDAGLREMADEIDRRMVADLYSRLKS